MLLLIIFLINGFDPELDIITDINNTKKRILWYNTKFANNTLRSYKILYILK